MATAFGDVVCDFLEKRGRGGSILATCACPYHIINDKHFSNSVTYMTNEKKEQRAWESTISLRKISFLLFNV